MASEVQGVVALAKGEPVELLTVVIPDPGPGEAVVRIQACGVCHTDLTTEKVGSVTSSRFCSGTRPRLSLRASGPTSRLLNPATSWC